MTGSAKHKLYILTIALSLLTAGLFVFCKFHYIYVLYFLAITLLTTLSHCLFRVWFANLIIQLFIKKLNHNSWWFRERWFEKNLYKYLMVKKWKSKLPTWYDEHFHVRTVERDRLISYICEAEVYHEICMVLSFIPLLYSIPFGKFEIFLWTSIGAAIFDLLFVIIQRYNRPRVERLRK